MPNRSASRSWGAVVSWKRIKLTGFWSILPKAELEAAGIHFETRGNDVCPDNFFNNSGRTALWDTGGVAKMFYADCRAAVDSLEDYIFSALLSLTQSTRKAL